MNAVDAANTPVEFDFKGRKLKLRRLSMEDLFAKTEARVISDHIAQGADMARHLPADEKLAFLRDHMTKTPDGVELRAKTDAFLKTIRGDRFLLFLAAKRDNKGIESEDDLAAFIGPDTSAEASTAADWVIGVKPKKAPSPGQAPDPAG